MANATKEQLAALPPDWFKEIYTGYLRSEEGRRKYPYALGSAGNTWKVPFRFSWRVRLKAKLSEFWRFTVLRQPRPVEYTTIIAVDFGEEPSFDSRAWTGR